MNYSKIFLQFFALVLLLFTISACSKSVESEEKSFDSNIKKIEKLQQEYPTFKAALASQIDKAKEAKKQADAESDEKKKIDKLSAANSAANSEFVRILSSLDREKKSLRKEIDKLQQTTLDETDRMLGERAIKNADFAIRQIDMVIQQGASTIDEAQGRLKNLNKQLKEANQDLAKVVRNAESKVTQKEEKKQQEEQTAQEQKQKEEEAKFITCEYCTSRNEATLTNCKSCGAGLNAKKK